MVAADRTSVGVSWHNQADDKETELVSGNYFQVLGLKPAEGRLLTPQDDTAKKADQCLVLSYDYWKSRFASSRDVIGQAVLINGHPFTVLGVAPQNFSSAIGGYRPGVFIPISMVEVAIPWRATHDDLTNHQSVWLHDRCANEARVSMSQAEASLGPLWHSLRAYELTLYKSRSERFKQGFLDNSRLKVKDDSTGFSPGRMQLKTPLIILMSMAGLLVAMCAINVSTAAVAARFKARAREMSMRYALRRKAFAHHLAIVCGGRLARHRRAAAGLGLAPLVATTLVRWMTPMPDPGQRAVFHFDGRTRPAVHPRRFNPRQPAVQHRACASFHPARSRHFGCADSGTAFDKRRSASARWPWALRSRSASSSWGGGRIVRPHARQSFAISPSVLKTANLATFNLRSPPVPARCESARRRLSPTRLKQLPDPAAQAAGNTDPDLTGSGTSSNFTSKVTSDRRRKYGLQITVRHRPGFFFATRDWKKSRGLLLVKGREF